jgi:GMP synthase-like glutamine amidotransferase
MAHLMAARVAFLEHGAWDVPGMLGERARSLGFDCEAFRADRGPAGLPRPDGFDALVVMGSAASVTDRTRDWIDHERRLVAGAVAGGTPVLGICFGGQLLAQVLGGRVTRADRREIGWRRLETGDPSRIPPGPWLVWHDDRITAPPGVEVVARTALCLHAFISGPHTGLQFHPEVDRDIVGHWVAEARAEGTMDEAVATELLEGFGGTGRGTEAQTHRLFDGFVERAGLSA